VLVVLLPETVVVTVVVVVVLTALATLVVVAVLVGILEMAELVVLVDPYRGAWQRAAVEAAVAVLALRIPAVEVEV
jgi:hypothetical protein